MTWTNFWPFCWLQDWGHFSVHLQIKISSLVKSTKQIQHFERVKYFFYPLASATCVRKELSDTTCKTILVRAQHCVASWEPRDGWWVGRGKLTRGRFGPNLPICLLSPNHPICLLSPWRLPHSTDSYFHPLVFVFVKLYFMTNMKVSLSLARPRVALRCKLVLPSRSWFLCRCSSRCSTSQFLPLL